MDNRLDIILFGGSGFTGKHCIGQIHKLSKANGRSLTWGIAGRSEEKLYAALSEYQKQTGEHLNFVPIIKADTRDDKSLRNMTAQARIIINCCGPYRFHGEPVVKACLETGTHQVDVTGEPQYIETIQLKYHKSAQEKGIYIVSACGFDSIPADLGVIFLQKNFKGTLYSVETYLQARMPDYSGPCVTYATWESAVHGIANAGELNDVRRKLYLKRFPNFKPKLKPRPPIHKIEGQNAWGVPFLGADRSVMQRSQRHLYENENVRPAQIQAYQQIDSIRGLIMFDFYKNLFMFLVKYKFGRKLLLKYPKIFSAGVCSHENPSDEKMNKTKVSITMRGEGWDEKLSNIEDDCKIRPNKSLVGYVSGYNPAYGITCTAVTLAAIVILTETDKLPKRGGVYPPGAAFVKTSIIEQLQQNGLTFEIKSKL